MAKKKEIKEIAKYKFQGSGLNRKAKKWAKKRFKQYETQNHIESYSDLLLLEDLVFLEALQEQFKTQMAEFSKAEAVKEGKVAPNHLIKKMDNNREQILKLKEKLGLFEEKKSDDPFNYIQKLKKKFKKWREENQGTRTTPCPHCSKMIMLKIRMKEWEALKHPFFKDRILANKRVWELYKEGKITKLDVAQILQGKEVNSTDYVDWLEKKIFPDSPSENTPNQSSSDK